MYECPNCTEKQEHEIYTCLHCRHVIKQLPTKEEEQSDGD
jgi:predicted RNA-binding Zn-ribbon protein involved in translation (DUF1610 family)